MEIQVIEQAGTTLAVIIGDIDGKTASIVQEQVLPLVSSGKNVLLDMGKVEYMSSAGLRLLLTLYRHSTANNGKLVLSGLSDEIRETMDATGFLAHFTVVNNTAEGIAAFSS